MVALQVVATTWTPLERLFDTTDLTLAQWGVALAVASTVLWVEELRKLVVRTLRSRRPPTEEVPSP